MSPDEVLQRLLPSKALAHDVKSAVKIAYENSSARLLRAWLYVPIGSALILAIIWSITFLLTLAQSSHTFPASVATLLLLFIALTVCSRIAGERRTRTILHVIDVPAGFALRWINVFFTPSFVLLPLSKSIAGVEVAKIIGVFFVGFMVVFATTAYFVRGLEWVLNLRKLGHAAALDRSDDSEDESGDEVESILLTITPGPSTSASETPLLPPSALSDPVRLRGDGPVPLTPASTVASVSSLPSLHRQNIAHSRAQCWGAKLTLHLDEVIYVVLLVFFGLPLLYAARIAAPAHLCVTVLSYRIAQRVNYLHPALLSSGLTIGGVSLLSASLKGGLHLYSTGSTVLVSPFNPSSTHTVPGAAEVLKAFLSISIVAMSLPVFKHRRSLPYLPLLLTILLTSSAHLTLYPLICHYIRLPAAFGKSFAVRNLTLALAQPAANALGADAGLTAVLCISSGILGALIGEKTLSWCGVGRERWAVRGVTVGVTASAVGTARLLEGGEARAAAVGVVAMVGVGVGVVAVTGVPIIVEGVGKLAG